MIKLKSTYYNYKPSLIDLESLNNIGSGVEGDVFKLSFNKIIKIYKPLKYNDWNRQKLSFKEIINIPHSNLATIFDFGIAFGTKNTQYNKYYISEKLFKLSVKESYVVDFIDENNFDELDNYHKNKYNKLFCVLKKLHNSRKYIVNDIHSGNLMKDKNGNYKMADLGLVFLK